MKDQPRTTRRLRLPAALALAALAAGLVATRAQGPPPRPARPVPAPWPVPFVPDPADIDPGILVPRSEQIDPGIIAERSAEIDPGIFAPPPLGPPRGARGFAAPPSRRRTLVPRPPGLDPRLWPASRLDR